MAGALPPSFWLDNSGRSLYRWLTSLRANTSNHNILVFHTQAHTSATSDNVLLNGTADRYASTVHTSNALTSTAPLLTFTMDKSALSCIDGYIECDLPTYSDDCLLTSVARDLSKQSLRMARGIHEDRPPPPYMCIRAYPTFSTRSSFKRNPASFRQGASYTTDTCRQARPHLPSRMRWLRGRAPHLRRVPTNSSYMGWCRQVDSGRDISRTGRNFRRVQQP